MRSALIKFHRNKSDIHFDFTNKTYIKYICLIILIPKGYVINQFDLILPLVKLQTKACLVYCFNRLLFFRRSSYLDTSSLVRRAVAPLYIVSCLVAPTSNSSDIWWSGYKLNIDLQQWYLVVRSLVVERRTAERAAGVRFPTCVPLARIQNRYGIPTGQFGSCPISIWRPGVLGLSSPGT